MGDAAWLRSAVGVADAATQALGLHEEVDHEAFVSSDAFGTPPAIPDAPVIRLAMVQRQEGILEAAGGQEIKFKAIVSFVRPVSIGPRDKITLRKDGMTGPLYIPAGGLSDPTTGQPFARLVYLRR